MTDTEYEAKFQEMQKYLPFIQKVIEKLKVNNDQNKDNPRKAQLEKMEMLHGLLTNKAKKLKMETLLKCEGVLIKLHTKIEKHSTILQDGEIPNKTAGVKPSKPTPSSSVAETAAKTPSKKNEKVISSAPASPSPDRLTGDDADNVEPVVIPTERRPSQDSIEKVKPITNVSQNKPTEHKSRANDTRNMKHGTSSTKPQQHQRPLQKESTTNPRDSPKCVEQQRKQHPDKKDVSQNKIGKVSAVTTAGLNKSVSSSPHDRNSPQMSEHRNIIKDLQNHSTLKHQQNSTKSTSNVPSPSGLQTVKVVITEPLPANIAQLHFPPYHQHRYQQQAAKPQYSHSPPVRNFNNIEIKLSDEKSDEAYNPDESWEQYNEAQRNKSSTKNVFQRLGDKVADDKLSPSSPTTTTTLPKSSPIAIPTQRSASIPEVLKSPPLSAYDINNLFKETGGDVADISEIGSRRTKRPDAEEPPSMRNSLDFVRQKLAMVAKIGSPQNRDCNSPSMESKNSASSGLTQERLALKYNPHPRQERLQSLSSNEGSECSQLSATKMVGSNNNDPRLKQQKIQLSPSSLVLPPSGVNVLPAINANDPRLKRQSSLNTIPVTTIPTPAVGSSYGPRNDPRIARQLPNKSCDFPTRRLSVSQPYISPEENWDSDPEDRNKNVPTIPPPVAVRNPFASTNDPRIARQLSSCHLGEFPTRRLSVSQPHISPEENWDSKSEDINKNNSRPFKTGGAGFAGQLHTSVSPRDSGINRDPRNSWDMHQRSKSAGRPPPTRRKSVGYRETGIDKNFNTNRNSKAGDLSGSNNSAFVPYPYGGGGGGPNLLHAVGSSPPPLAPFSNSSSGLNRFTPSTNDNKERMRYYDSKKSKPHHEPRNYKEFKEAKERAQALEAAAAKKAAEATQTKTDPKKSEDITETTNKNLDDKSAMDEDPQNKNKAAGGDRSNKSATEHNASTSASAIKAGESTLDKMYRTQNFNTTQFPKAALSFKIPKKKTAEEQQSNMDKKAGDKKPTPPPNQNKNHPPSAAKNHNTNDNNKSFKKTAGQKSEEKKKTNKSTNNDDKDLVPNAPSNDTEEENWDDEQPDKTENENTSAESDKDAVVTTATKNVTKNSANSHDPRTNKRQNTVDKDQENENKKNMQTPTNSRDPRCRPRGELLSNEKADNKDPEQTDENSEKTSEANKDVIEKPSNELSNTQKFLEESSSLSLFSINELAKPKRIMQRRCTMLTIGSAPLVDKDKLLKANALMLEDVEQREKLKRQKEEEEKQSIRRNKHLAEMFRKTDDNCTVSTQNIITGKRRTRASINFNETKNAMKVFKHLHRKDPADVPAAPAAAKTPKSKAKSKNANENEDGETGMDTTNTNDETNPMEKAQEGERNKPEESEKKEENENENCEGEKEREENVKTKAAVAKTKKAVVKLPNNKKSVQNKVAAKKPTDKELLSTSKSIVTPKNKTSSVAKKTENDNHQTCTVSSSTSADLANEERITNPSPVRNLKEGEDVVVDDNEPSTSGSKSNPQTPASPPPQEEDSDRHAFLDEFVQEIIKPNADKTHILCLLGQILSEDKLQIIKSAIESTAKTKTDEEGGGGEGDGDGAENVTKEDIETRKQTPNRSKTKNVKLKAKSNKVIKKEMDSAAEDAGAGDAEDEGGDHDDSLGSVKSSKSSGRNTPNTQRRKRNELDRLNDDIRDMFICEGVLTATGKRMCTLMNQNSDDKVVDTANKSFVQPQNPDANEANNNRRSGRLKPPQTAAAAKPEKSQKQALRRSLRGGGTTKLAVTKNEEEELDDDTETINSNDTADETESNATEETNKTAETTPTRRKMPVLKPNTPIKLPEESEIEKLRQDTSGGGNKRKSTANNNKPCPKSKKLKSSNDKEESLKSEEASESEHEEEDTKMEQQDQETNDLTASLPAVKNTNINWHNQSKYTTWCMVCDKRILAKSCSFHYKLNHGESYISRLAPILVQKFKQGKLCRPMFGVERRIKNPSWFHRCPFCLSYFNTTIALWLEHFQNHTAEFRYECSKCHWGSNRNPSIKRHMTTSCKTASIIHSTVKLEVPTTIKAYVCHLCNFLQLKRPNLERHYVEQHLLDKKNVDLLGYTITLFDHTDVERISEAEAQTREEEARELIAKEEKVIDIDGDGEEAADEAETEASGNTSPNGDNKEDDTTKNKADETDSVKANEPEKENAFEISADNVNVKENKTNVNEKTKAIVKEEENTDVKETTTNVEANETNSVASCEQIEISKTPPKDISKDIENNKTGENDNTTTMDEKSNEDTNSHQETSTPETAEKNDESTPQETKASEKSNTNESSTIEKPSEITKDRGEISTKANLNDISTDENNSEKLSNESEDTEKPSSENEDTQKSYVEETSPSTPTKTAASTSGQIKPVTPAKLKIVSPRTTKVALIKSNDESDIFTPNTSVNMAESPRLSPLKTNSVSPGVRIAARKYTIVFDKDNNSSAAVTASSPAKHSKSNNFNCKIISEADEAKEIQDELLSLAAMAAAGEEEDFVEIICDPIEMQDELLSLAAQAAAQEVKEVVATNNQMQQISNDDTNSKTGNSSPTKISDIVANTIDMMYQSSNKRKSDDDVTEEEEQQQLKTNKKHCPSSTNETESNICLPSSHSSNIKVLASSIVTIDKPQENSSTTSPVTTSIAERLSQRLKDYEEETKNKTAALNDESHKEQQQQQEEKEEDKKHDIEDKTKIIVETHPPSTSSNATVTVISDDEEWEDIEVTESAPNTNNSNQKSKNKGLFQKFGLFKTNPSKSKKHIPPLLFYPKKKTTNKEKIVATQSNSSSPITTFKTLEHHAAAAADKSQSPQLGFKSVINIMDNLLPDSPCNDPIDLVPELTPLEPLTDLNDISSIFNSNLSVMGGEVSLQIDESHTCIQDALDFITEQATQGSDSNTMTDPLVTSTKTPTTKRIQNVGYTKKDDKLKFYCLLENCSFLFSSDAMGLENHFLCEHSQIKWKGYCEICQSQCLDDGQEYAIRQEIKHMVEEHANKSQIEINSDSSQGGCVVAFGSEERPRIKLRRMTGDCLSTSNSESPTPTAISTPTNSAQQPTTMLGALLNAKPKPPTKEMPPHPEMPLTEPLLIDDKITNISSDFMITSVTSTAQVQESPFQISNVVSLSEVNEKTEKDSSSSPSTLPKIANVCTLSGRSTGNLWAQQIEEERQELIDSAAASLEVSNILANARNPSTYCQNRQLSSEIDSPEPIVVAETVPVAQATAGNFVITQTVSTQYGDDSSSAAVGFNISIEASALTNVSSSNTAENSESSLQTHSPLVVTEATPPLQLLNIPTTTIRSAAANTSQQASSSSSSSLTSRQYKCMGNGCKFSTRVPVAMSDHLRFHERRNLSTRCDYFACGFCMYQATDVEDYMKHCDQYHIIGKGNKLPPGSSEQGGSSASNICDILSRKMETTNAANRNINSMAENNATTAAAKQKQNEEDYLQKLRATIEEIVAPTGFSDDKLYRCVVKHCRVQLTESTFHSHIMYHISTLGIPNPNNYVFKCPHCIAQYHRPAGIKAHIKNHARNRYFCYLCEETSANAGQMLKHFSEKHWHTLNLFTKELLPAKVITNADGTEQIQDSCYYLVYTQELSESEVRTYGEKLILEWQRKKSGSKTHFKSSEIELLPMTPIFQREINCGECEYKTKVRTNMYRHLLMHKQNPNLANNSSGQGVVASVDPVNPVPCLNSNEKFFDKMTNLASSSLIPQSSQSSSAGSKNPYIIPQAFIADSNRFKCGIPECNYVTISEDIFRSHLSTLHGAAQNYRCPFCNEEICKRGMSAERVVAHLRFHAATIYRCEECNYIHYQRYIVERHANDKHATNKVNLMRYDRSLENPEGTITITPFAGKKYKENTDANQTTHSSAASTSAGTTSTSSSSTGTSSLQANENSSTSAGTSKSSSSSSSSKNKSWICDICKHKASTLNQIQNHCQNSHGQSNPYQCMHCPFGHNKLSQILYHIDEIHPGKPRNARHIYHKNVNDSAIDAVDTRPLWQRNDPTRIRHIRGILMEDEEESEKYRKKLGLDKVADDEGEEDDETDDVEKETNYIKGYEFGCLHCNHTCERIDELYATHYLNAHSMPVEVTKPFMFRLLNRVCCPECRKFTGNFHELQIHLLKAHYTRNYYAADISIAETDDNTQRLVCGYCTEFTCSKPDQLMKHFRLKDSHSPQDVNIKNMTQLADILKLGNNETYFQCTMCSQLFGGRVAIVQHAITMHSNDEGFSFKELSKQIIYQCSLCQHSTTAEEDLLRHMIDHYGRFKRCHFCHAEQESFERYMQHCYAEHRDDISHFKRIYPMASLEQFLIEMLVIFPNGLVISKKNLVNTKYGDRTIINKLYEDMYKISQQPPIPRLSIARLVARKSIEAHQKPKSGNTSPQYSMSEELNVVPPAQQQPKKITKRRCTVISTSGHSDDINNSGGVAPKRKSSVVEEHHESSSFNQSTEFNMPLAATHAMCIKKRRRTVASDNNDKLQPSSATSTSLSSSPSPPQHNPATDYEGYLSKKSKLTLETVNASPSTSLDLEPFSFYGIKPEPIDLSKIYTKVAIGGINTPLTIDKFKLLFNIDCQLKLTRVKCKTNNHVDDDDATSSTVPNYIEYKHIKKACPASHKMKFAEI